MQDVGYPRSRQSALGFAFGATLTAHTICFCASPFIFRWEDSLVLPPGAPMVVLSKSRPFLLVAFDTFTGREGRLRLHRNWVSVVERLTWLDATLATLAR